MRLSTRLYLAVTAVVASVLARPVVAPARAGRSRRGAGLVEYLLLAAIAVVLILLLREQLRSIINSIIDRIEAALNG